jgi:hypothetical protein
MRVTSSKLLTMQSGRERGRGTSQETGFLVVVAKMLERYTL